MESPYSLNPDEAVWWKPMNPAAADRPFQRAGVAGLMLLGCMLGFGCATQTHAPAPPIATTERSPTAMVVSTREAWTLAEAFVAANPGCEILVGRGDSMLPLYPDRTILVVQAMKIAELRRGMTVVFQGDRGRPVAHALVGQTPRGWIAMGSGNREPDRTPVQFRNYIGTVVRAYTPSGETGSLAFDVTVLPAAERLARDDSDRPRSPEL